MFWFDAELWGRVTYGASQEKLWYFSGFKIYIFGL